MLHPAVAETILADATPRNDGTMTDARMITTTVINSSVTLANGHVLANRYRVARFIAAGGMGEVYEAEDTLLGEHVALKLLRPELSSKPGAQARFADEIRMARKVTHRNVCRVFDVSIDGDRVFFTMELHAGTTLASLLERSAPLDLEQARAIIRQLLAGIAAAHAAEVVHTDLKPSNVLLAGGGDRVVLTDFGLAVPCCAELGCRCDAPHLIGTPAYMSPEQVIGGMALERTDVFSVGVILYEMVTGHLPFCGATPLEMAQARLGAPPEAPSTLRPGLDAQWDEVILRCLAREPAARPASVQDVARALELD